MSTDGRRGRRGRRTAVVVAVLLVLAGTAAVVGGLAAQDHAPQPPVSAASSSGASTAASGAVPSAPTFTGTPAQPGPSLAPGAVRPLVPSPPTHLEVPAIGVSTDLLQLGQNADGTVQVPPLARDSRAGWYRYSPTPGELGPAVLLGHVDSAEYGPGVFFRLGALEPGDTLSVTRADDTVATFRVTRVASFPKDQFPTLDVYGNTADAQVRLITCGGAFDSSARSYENNIVVYAALTGGPTG
jgi:hypothetical protein